MTEEEIQEIENAYEQAASSVGIPDGWFVRVETAKWVSESMENMGTFGMDEDLDQIAMPMLVDDSGMAHTVAEHKGPVKSVHAERNLERGLSEHPSS